MNILVQKVIQRTKDIHKDYPDLLGDKEKILSLNKVCGWSLNLPIYGTCRPTKTCIKTCYYAKGGTSWPASLKKQLRTLNSFRNNWKSIAEKIISEYDKNGCDYLRWNGGGDLFEESVKAINYIIEERPDMVLWIVTRRLDMAALIKQDENKHVHISLDAFSMDKYDKYIDMDKLSDNYFFSYQAAKSEILDPEIMPKIDVLFYDGYKETAQLFEVPDHVFCGLTKGRLNGDISLSCDSCRKCFDVNKRTITK